MSYRLSDVTKNLIIKYIQAGLPAVLASVAADTADGKVSLPSPKHNSYFTYPNAKAYDAPAVFVIVDKFDFRVNERGQNHVNAVVDVNVAIVVEDKTAELLVLKTDRYLDALYEILNNAHIDDAGNKVRLVIVVTRASFSPEYTDAGMKDSSQGRFRKEVHFECEVQHYTNKV